MSGGRLIIISGLPGSGKTTFARALAAQTSGMVFCADDWLEALEIDLWNLERRRQTEKLQWQQALGIMRLGGTAIIEWGTWSRSERDQLRQGAQAVGAKAELIFLDAAPEVLYARTIARGRENPPIALDQFHAFSAAIERPTDDELALYDASFERPLP